MASQGTLQAIDLYSLNLFYRNARRGDIPAIMESLRVNTQYSPITVNAGTLTGRPLEVLAGNNTLLAARELDWAAIDCYVIDVDNDAALRINLADNKIAQLGGFDDAVLAELLADLSSFDGTGYAEQDLADLNALLGPPPDDITPAPVPSEPAAEPVAEPDPETPADTTGPRSISLGGLPPLYIAWLHDRLAELKEEFNVDSSADVLLALVITRTGKRPE